MLGRAVLKVRQKLTVFGTLQLGTEPVIPASIRFYCANLQFSRNLSTISRNGLLLHRNHFASNPILQSETTKVKGTLVESNELSESDVESTTIEGEVEYTLTVTDDVLKQITGNDPELIKKVKYIQLEHEVYRQEGMRVPSKVSLNNWKELLQLHSPNGRRKFYNYLWLNEMKDENDKIKKLQKREERLKELPPRLSREEDFYGMTYGLGRNSIFLRLYDSTINKLYHNKIVNAMMFSRPIVLDCGFDEFMTAREAKNCAKQIEIFITQNRTHQQPFDLHLCNANPRSKTMDYLHKIIPTIYDDDYPINITEKSYLDIFPQKELVYLSPHARDILDKYDEDEIYIVGAMVDKTDPRPFSLAKAKKENIRLKKLPLDQYLMWGLGTKSLTINQMASIMLDIRYTRNWKLALDHVPKRKLNRTFHPYPDQEAQKPQEFQQSYRRESKSSVLQDFELLNQRKGFRKSDSKSFSFTSRGSSNQRKQESSNTSSFKVKSIFHDD